MFDDNAVVNKLKVSLAPILLLPLVQILISLIQVIYGDSQALDPLVIAQSHLLHKLRQNQINHRIGQCLVSSTPNISISGNHSQQFLTFTQPLSVQSTQNQSYSRIGCVFQGQVIVKCRSYLNFKFNYVVLSGSMLTPTQERGYLRGIHFIELGCNEKKSGRQKLVIFISECNTGRQTMQIGNSKILSIPCHFFCVCHDPLDSCSSLPIIGGIDGARRRRGSLGEAGQ